MIALPSYHDGIACHSSTTQLLIIIIVFDDRVRLTIYANMTRLFDSAQQFGEKEQWNILVLR
jgi:hypothetical protein